MDAVVTIVAFAAVTAVDKFAATEVIAPLAGVNNIVDKVIYTIPKNKTPNRFFAQRVQKWLLHPELDEQLTQEIISGKYPALKIMLDKKEE